MNNPRNRQQQSRRQDQDSTRRSDRSYAPRPSPSSVPSVQQVTRGAAVSIVLKEDQPTGREVQGTVQDLLTRGNHPRGIKVRLTDGRVGRVQKMSGAAQSAPQVAQAPVSAPTNYRREGAALPSTRDVRFDEYEAPPVRTFFDFLPAEMRNESTVPTNTTPTAKCPICGEFEGDEVAVSRHVDEHLS
nr:hypothetical protein B0A51_09730 [Rachicladosporium sp. CCFEE 5018]